MHIYIYIYRERERDYLYVHHYVIISSSSMIKYLSSSIIYIYVYMFIYTANTCGQSHTNTCAKYQWWKPSFGFLATSGKKTMISPWRAVRRDHARQLKRHCFSHRHTKGWLVKGWSIDTITNIISVIIIIIHIYRERERYSNY